MKMGFSKVCWGKTRRRRYRGEGSGDPMTREVVQRVRSVRPKGVVPFSEASWLQAASDRTAARMDRRFQVEGLKINWFTYGVPGNRLEQVDGV